MKIFLFYFEMAIKLQGRHKIIGSVGLAETHLFFLGLMSKEYSALLKRFTIRFKRLDKFGFPMTFLNLYTKSP